MHTRQQRIEQAERWLAQGRITHRQWRGHDAEGRELVCALAAFGNDIGPGRSYPADAASFGCPADLMPSWLARMIPEMDDAITLKDVPWFMRELLDRVKRWDQLSPQQWGRIRAEFKRYLGADAITEPNEGFMQYVKGYDEKHSTSRAKEAIKRFFTMIDAQLPSRIEPEPAPTETATQSTGTPGSLLKSAFQLKPETTTKPRAKRTA